METSLNGFRSDKLNSHGKGSRNSTISYLDYSPCLCPIGLFPGIYIYIYIYILLGSPSKESLPIIDIR